MKILTAAQMQALDHRTIMEAHIPSLTLMERAGLGVVQQLECASSPLKNKLITVVCGKGNNGGDGLVVARLLVKKKINVHVILLTKPTELSRDAKVMHGRLVHATQKGTIHVSVDTDKLRALLAVSDVIVDAIFGIGLSGTVSGFFGEAITAINGARRQVIAVDIPSGLDADTGATLGPTVRADHTVTLGL
ncbi:MAG: NAD(P)H-hydrate epimerase, partial [Nitrospiraceae bacterium]